MNIVVPITIPTGIVSNMLVSAFESNYSPWIGSVECPNYAGKENWWYADDEFVESENFHFTINYDGEDDEEGSAASKKTVTRADVLKGLELMARNSTSHFADVVADNADAITADVFMQYVVLGEIVYG